MAWSGSTNWPSNTCSALADRSTLNDREDATVTLVAGVDSSTQSCKVVVCDADSGEVLRSGSAPHPAGTEVAPKAWTDALRRAIEDAGGVDDVAALSVGGQQHGMVCLDQSGRVVRQALLWNDTRSGTSATDLVNELGGPDEGAKRWAEATGSVPVASFTVAKLRWLRDHEPQNAARTETVCLPHDWITWQLAGADARAPAREGGLATDRSEASGTGYYSAATGEYRLDLLELALGRTASLPFVLRPNDPAGAMRDGPLLGCGAGDNAAAALGLGARLGDVVVSIGTSGTVSAVAERPTADASGTIAGFADATGHFLPLVCTMNAARVLDSTATLLGVSLDELSELALSAAPGAGGLVIVPYLEGERTPNRPYATGAVHGLRLDSWTRENLARAAVEGMLCGLAAGLDALVDVGVPVNRVILIGGGSRSEAVRTIAAGIFGQSVVVPAAAQHVALGAARQVAWMLSQAATPPEWAEASTRTYDADPLLEVREQYLAVVDMTIDTDGAGPASGR